MTALDELLNDYAWLRRGEPDANNKDRDRLVQRVLAERERLQEKARANGKKKEKAHA